MKKLLFLILGIIVIGICLGSVSTEKKTSINGSTYDNDVEDSFIVIYNKPVYGYQVKAVVKLIDEEFPVLSANLTFTKDGDSFTLPTSCFGDSLFCKGRMGCLENEQVFEKYHQKTVAADYRANKEDGRTFPIGVPFFFMDMDFDGVEDLVIVHQSMADRFHDGYDVYRIVEGKPILINYPPFWNEMNYGFGMADYPKVSFRKKMISCPYPEGEMTYEGMVTYGISKSRKDTIVVNGRTHCFNHLDTIKTIKYK